MAAAVSFTQKSCGMRRRHGSNSPLRAVAEGWPTRGFLEHLANCSMVRFRKKELERKLVPEDSFDSRP